MSHDFKVNESIKHLAFQTQVQVFCSVFVFECWMTKWQEGAKPLNYLENKNVRPRFLVNLQVTALNSKSLLRIILMRKCLASPAEVWPNIVKIWEDIITVQYSSWFVSISPVGLTLCAEWKKPHPGQNQNLKQSQWISAKSCWESWFYSLWCASDFLKLLCWFLLYFSHFCRFTGGFPWNMCQ